MIGDKNKLMFIPKEYRKIFVTGGAGFIGSHIVDELIADGRMVVVFDNLSSGEKLFLKKSLSSKNLKLIKGDLLDKNSIAGALPKNTDLVIHLAANPDISKGIKDPTLDFNQTIIATFNLLQIMKAKEVKSLVYFSGSGVYGDLGNTYSREDLGPLFPISMYGASKLSAEGLISAFSHLFGIQSWILRPANIIGDRATHGVIFDFIGRLRRNPNELVILGDGLQSKSYVHISDVLRAVSIIVNKTKENINIFNLASTTFITVNEIAEIIIKEMALNKVLISHTEGRIGWPGDVAIVRIDSSKIRQVGWKEKYTSKTAVEKTVRDLLVTFNYK